MAIRKSIIYTNRKHSVFGIMSSFFGLLSTVTFILCIYESYKVRGNDIDRFGTSALLGVIFLIAGVVLFVLSFFEGDRFKLFIITAGVFNVTALLGLSLILYAGAIL